MHFLSYSQSACVNDTLLIIEQKNTLITDPKSLLCVIKNVEFQEKDQK